jgi:hypothetical protein
MEGYDASLCLVTSAKRYGTIFYLPAACGRMHMDSTPRIGAVLGEGHTETLRRLLPGYRTLDHP